MAGKRAKIQDQEDGLDESEKLVLDYMNQQNRPYGANDVFMNLHGKVGKTQVTKILASLLDRGLLGGKAYGKTCIYVARQDNFPAPSNEELETIDEEIKQLVEQVAQQRESTQQSQARLNKLQNTLTVEEMQTRLMQVTKEMESLETRLQVLRSGDNKVDAAAKAKLDSQFDLLHKEWRLRKRMCMDAIYAITENLPQSPKKFMEELGMDLDPVETK